MAGLGHGYAVSGEGKKARQILAELDKLSLHKYVRAYAIALVAVALGQKDKALHWIEKAINQRDIYLILLRNERRFDPLRSDPRFQSLLRRLHFPEGTAIEGPL